MHYMTVVLLEKSDEQIFALTAVGCLTEEYLPHCQRSLDSVGSRFPYHKRSRPTQCIGRLYVGLLSNQVIACELLLQLGEVLDGANHLRNIRVLVVVPRNNLNLVVVIVELQNHGLSCIEE